MIPVLGEGGNRTRTSLEVQWLGLCASNAGGTGSIPGRGTKILRAVWYSQILKKDNN